MGFGIMYFNSVRNPVKNLSNNFFQIQTFDSAIHAYQPDLSTILFKVSPFDDYYYQGFTKTHITEISKFKKNTFPVDLFNFANKLFSPNRQILTVHSNNLDNSKIKYQFFIDKTNTVQIKRTLEGINAEFIGMSFIICDDCFIADQSKYIYLDQTLSSYNTNSIKANQYTPVYLNQQLLPNFISKITVLNNKLDELFAIDIDGNQQIFYDKKYNIIEIKTPYLDEGVYQKIHIKQ